MVWDKNNAALVVIKQKVLINNREKEWAGEEVIGNKSVFSYTNIKNATKISSCNM